MAALREELLVGLQAMALVQLLALVLVRVSASFSSLV